jgi:hypothetical protein
VGSGDDVECQTAGRDRELHVRGQRRRHLRAGHGVGLGAAVLVLVACGGDDDAAEAEVDTAAPSEDATGAGSPEDATDGADTDEMIAADVIEEAGMATLRPPADTEPDCEAIDELAPGASLDFPTDEAGMLDAGPGPVRVEFVGCSNTFEANLVYDAFHGDDTTPTLTDVTMGGSMGEWAPFSFEEMFWTPGRWTVVVYEDDAATGDRQEYDQVTFSID